MPEPEWPDAREPAGVRPPVGERRDRGVARLADAADEAAHQRALPSAAASSRATAYIIGGGTERPSRSHCCA